MKRPQIAQAIDTTEFFAPRIAQVRLAFDEVVDPRRVLERYLTPERRPEDQGLIELIVQGLLRGEDMRSIFAIWEKPGVKPNDAREVAAVSEVARMAHELHDRVEAIYQVAEVFHVAVRTVERWCAELDDRSVNVPGYIAELKAAGLLQ